ncbi:MAG TPA: hypothetical protein VEA40_15530, partial [Ramlibacter sp.]|nr:hypothetical protein [Ramlibacter sp.]
MTAVLSDPIDGTAVLDAPTPSATQTKVDPNGRVHRIAAMVHRAIDKVEKGLGSGSAAASASSESGLGAARAYGDKLRGHINARPLQSAGIAVGTGVILDKVFSRSPAVKVVQVPVPTRPAWDSAASPVRQGRRWADAAGSQADAWKSRSQSVLQKLAAKTESGLAETRSMSRGMARTVSGLPDGVRLATRGLVASSQRYGSMARNGIQAHPLVGIGVLATAGAVLTTALLRRDRPASSAPLAGANERGTAAAWADSPVEEA